jgi:S-formylglutathione hydrolase
MASKQETKAARPEASPFRARSSHIKSEQLCFGGVQGFYSHASIATGTEMRFAVFVPPQAKAAPVQALYYLAGLTCTEETFAIKAGAQRMAAALGLMLVACIQARAD